ncbi:MAG: ATP-binding protein, partial [Myxococcota bacterium]
LNEGCNAVLFENRYRTRAGEWRWLQWNSRPANEGLFYCTVRDVTERKRIERLQSRRERYLQMAEGLANFGYWHVNLVTRAVQWSDEVFKIHGLDVGNVPTLEEAISFYHPADRPTVEEHMAAAVESKSGFQFELRLIRADETVRYVESRGRVELNDEGEVSGIFGVFMDITDRIEVQRELERQSRKLRQFVHVASHDLQEPLRMVTSYMDLIREGYSDVLDARGRRFVGYAYDGAQRMKTLVDDVLAFSRSSRFEPQMRDVSIQSVVDTVKHDLTMLLEEHGGSIEAVGELPTVQTDPTLLSLIVQNLVNNAVKFHRPDQPARCTVSAWGEGSIYGLTVADNGIGIAEHQHARIFEPFCRLHRRDCFDGNGIGLSIVRDAVDALGGSIRVESRPNEGARFVVEVNAPSKSATPARPILRDAR